MSSEIRWGNPACQSPVPQNRDSSPSGEQIQRSRPDAEMRQVLGSLPGRVSVDVGLHKKTRPTYLSRASQRRYGTYLPTYPARAGHYNGSYVHVMSSHHLVVRRTLSHCAAGAGKNRMWADFALFFRARLRFRDSPRSALTYFRSLCVRSSGISPPAASVARAFDQSLVSDVSTMFYRYISYSRYIWLKL